VSPRQRRPGAFIRKVVLYKAAGCHLCERALNTLESLRERAPFELEQVDIGGDPELEARYREWLPVVEIDGERVFVYHVPPEAFVRRVTQTSAL
jgi:glutaredoxin